MGRNIWQNDHPIAMIKAIRPIVHEKAAVKEVVNVFEENKKTNV